MTDHTSTQADTPQRSRLDVWGVGITWAVLTIAGETWAISTEFQPLAGSDQAGVIDDAFRLLVLLAIPVVAFVVAMLGWSLLRFRDSDRGEDGPPLRTHRGFVGGWVAVSTALAILVIFNPGLKGLAELDELAEDPDMTVLVHAEQWNWSYTYEEYGIDIEDADVLVLPVDATVRFEITSEDVIHSFWIPVFRIKMDAVPGKVTTITATATSVGTFSDDAGFRVQCAELCGTGHARMRTTVEVVAVDEFEEWLEANR